METEKVIDNLIKENQAKMGLGFSRYILVALITIALITGASWLLFPAYTQFLLYAGAVTLAGTAAGLYSFFYRRNQGKTGALLLCVMLVLAVTIAMFAIPAIIPSAGIAYVAIIIVSTLLLGKKESLWLGVVSGVGLAASLIWAEQLSAAWFEPLDETVGLIFNVAVSLSTLTVTILIVSFQANEQEEQFRQAQHTSIELESYKTSLEQTVAKRTAELNRLLDSISDAVISTTLEGKILSWNPAAERLFGWTAEEAVGESVAMLFPTQDTFLALQNEAVQAAMAGTPQQAEISMICKDNSERVARIGFSAIFDDQNNPTGIVAIVADITEQKQMEAEQERLQQEVIAAQQQVIQELSTPVIPVMQGIIVMPLVGNIDSMRAQDVTRSLLAGISQHRARTVIIDVTGVSLMDTGIVDRLNKTIQAAQLKGAQTIVTGISDAVAESIVDLGIDWSGITTLSNLQAGLVRALGSLGIELKGNSR